MDSEKGLVYKSMKEKYDYLESIIIFLSKQIKSNPGDVFLTTLLDKLGEVAISFLDTQREFVHLYLPSGDYSIKEFNEKYDILYSIADIKPVISKREVDLEPLPSEKKFDKVYESMQTNYNLTEQGLSIIDKQINANPKDEGARNLLDGLGDFATKVLSMQVDFVETFADKKDRDNLLKRISEKEFSLVRGLDQTKNIRVA